MAKINKLSPAQEKVLQEAKDQITLARQYNTYEEYFIAIESPYYSLLNTPEKCKAHEPKMWEYYENYWKNKINGIVFCHASSATLRKLESLGYIKILKDQDMILTRNKIIQILNF